MAFRVPEQYRVRDGRVASSEADGNNGVFRAPLRRRGRQVASLYVLASDGLGWEHVSVSHHLRTPTWGKMSMVRDAFWEPEDTVMQLHVPASEHVNYHPHCLHLWRPVAAEIPRPPTFLVGPAGASAPPGSVRAR